MNRVRVGLRSRGNPLRNGFGESGFEMTSDATNRVALLPSGQRVGLHCSQSHRPNSDLLATLDSGKQYRSDYISDLHRTWWISRLFLHPPGEDR